jgi:hypothetical protein
MTVQAMGFPVNIPVNTAAAAPSSYMRYWPNGIPAGTTWEVYPTVNAAAGQPSTMYLFNWRNDPPPPAGVPAYV